MVNVTWIRRTDGVMFDKEYDTLADLETAMRKSAFGGELVWIGSYRCSAGLFEDITYLERKYGFLG